MTMHELRHTKDEQNAIKVEKSTIGNVAAHSGGIMAYCAYTCTLRIKLKS